MSRAIENLIEAQKFAMSIRPKVGGFPFLAEALRKFGITRNLWSLPSCQSIYYTKYGVVVQQGAPLAAGAMEVAKFNQEALIHALRRDQAGQSSFPDFLKSSWEAGVVSYDVDLEHRKVTYWGTHEESYTEDYPVVEIQLEK